jgi:hypothetical protein
MALLLRQAGIASRLVSGFLPGEWNPFGNYLLVRQQDAHTWVEVYFPESGWVLFDPTPPSEEGRPFALVSAYLDWMKTRWDRYVIHYSIFDQISMVRDGWQWFNNPGIRSRKEWALPRVPLLAITAAAAAVGLWLLRRYFWLTGSPTARHGGRKEREATRIYRRLLRLLEKKGWSRGKGETPMEFIRELPPENAIAPQLDEITGLYYAARFGPDRNAPEKLASALERLRERLNELEGSIRRNLSGPSSRSRPDSPTAGSAPPPGGDGPAGSDRAKDPTGRHKPARPNRPA